MRVDHYVEKLSEKKEQKAISPFKFRDLNTFERIDKEKKELIRSVRDYLYDDEFKDILYYYNDFYFPVEQFGMVQCIDEDKVRCLESIRLWEESDSDYKPSIITPRDEFLKIYKSLRKIGSQEYAYATIKATKWSDEPEYYNIYYTNDGNVFINAIEASNFAYWDIDNIGERLAVFCKYHPAVYEKKQKEHKLRLEPNYRKLR